jgi:hypothetical protein
MEAEVLTTTLLFLRLRMTKVTLHYDLTRALTDEDFNQIALLPSTYGMARAQVAPSLDKITVDYDASRLMKTDVEAVLSRHGIPIRMATA